jgi:hypothetical protein
MAVRLEGGAEGDRLARDRLHLECADEELVPEVVSRLIGERRGARLDHPAARIGDARADDA